MYALLTYILPFCLFILGADISNRCSLQLGFHFTNVDRYVTQPILDYH
jgi:hypothetical protein